MSAPVLFELQGVDLHLGAVQALTACDLRIQAGETVALVGANGGGKSSLLRCLHGLIEPSRGQLRRAPVPQAMVFQRPWMLRASALSNVAMGLWLRGMGWGAARQRARQAIERVGLSELAERSGQALSGGQQQRLALARAWALQAQVLLLDEPTASLDPAGKREVEQLMAEFAAGGMTLIFATHNLGQVKRLAGRVLYLEQGRLLDDAPVDRFFDPQRPGPAAAFLRGDLL
ncbi:MAG: ATP-binding cassette domain-containing protein [Betaproteobacteria bacterium]